MPHVFGLARLLILSFLAAMIFSPGPRPATVCRILALAAFALAGFTPGASAANARSRARSEADSGTYRSAIVIDAADGKALFEDRADVVSAPASMTKLMTYAVLHDKLAKGDISLSTPIKIEESDMKMGGTGVWLDPRETFSVEELIYAMMIQSANDAAHALARGSAGSRGAFVELMNAKARELGMNHTSFNSPHGLPPNSRRTQDGDISTARDFAVLCRHLLLRTDVLKYTSVSRRMFGNERASGPIDMINHNKLLGKVAGVDGLKTGYTKDAGYCLSATAERNGRRLVVVIMGSYGPGGRADYGQSRDLKTIELMEKGFAALPVGSSNFAAARGKFVQPAVIPLDGPTSKPVPAGAPAVEADAGPKLTLPPRRR